jgi:tRNA(fMet)-specific endonuclease VapC
MSVYLLDTDTVTLVQAGHTTLLANMRARLDANINISALSIQEQMQGWLGRLNRLQAPPQMAAWYDRFVHYLFPIWKRFTILPFTEPAIRRFEHLKSLRLNVGPMDLRIAAVALENGLIVVTRNRRDFGRVPGLVSDDWSV